jgi:hypothetical protein
MIREWHEKRELGIGIQYHITILGTGKVMNTRPEYQVGNHCFARNDFSIGVAICGDFTKERPIQEQLDALEAILVKLCRKYKLNAWDVYGHSEIALEGHPTACPGTNLLKELSMMKVRVSQSLKKKGDRPSIVLQVTKYPNWNDRLISWLIGILDKMRR